MKKLCSFNRVMGINKNIAGLMTSTYRHMASQRSIFNGLKEGPMDPILGTAIRFRNDPDPRKVMLGIGAYRDSAGKPYVFNVIKQVERELSVQHLDKEYLSIDGDARLKPLTQRLVFGDSCPPVENKCVTSVQTLSGTGAVRVVAEFIRTYVPSVSQFLVSKPTWGNHLPIIRNLGFELIEYPYYSNESRKVDIKSMIACLEEIHDGQAVLLHPAAHNPTGCDPAKEEWQAILDVVKRKNHIAIFDSAYQGFATGDVDADAYPMRLFAQAGLEMFVCQSFAKNLGLYGERAGMAHVVTKSEEQANICLSLLKTIIRPMYSNPPIHAARLVIGVLGDDEKRAAWKKELKSVADRIASIRVQLRDGLVKKGTPGNWDHIVSQIGMFSYTGLSPEQCDRLTDVFHIHLLRTGRISLAGLNDSNLQYVIDAIDDVVRNS